MVPKVGRTRKASHRKEARGGKRLFGITISKLRAQCEERETNEMQPIRCLFGITISKLRAQCEERETNEMQPIRCLLFYYQTSISTCFGHHYAHHRENKTVYYCIWCSALVVLVEVGCGCVELGRQLCALYEGYCSNSNLHTAYDPAPHHNQHNQCRTPYAVTHGLVLPMMGIMMPETC